MEGDGLGYLLARQENEVAMRFLNIQGPGIATDEDFCPNCHVLLEERYDYKVCPLCRYDTRRFGARRRTRVRR